MAKLVVLGASAGAAGAFTHCTNAYQRDEGGADAASDAATDAGHAGTDGGVDPCAHVGPPPPPLADDAPLDVLPDLVFAVRSTRLGATLGLDAGAPPSVAPLQGIGFDLDHTCTCQTTTLGACSSLQATVACDLDGGVDDALLGLQTLLPASIGAAYQSGIDSAIGAGDLTQLFVVSNYNGQANDLDIRVQVMTATRPDSAPATGCTTTVGTRPPSDPASDAGSGGPRAPAWDGCDRWGVIAASVPFAGYVTNHRLVVLGGADVPMLIGPSSVATVKAPRLVAVLQRSASGSFTLEDGELAGRAPASAVVSAFGRVTSASAPLCMSAVLSALASAMCGRRDLPSSPAADGTDVPCDAMSVAVAFRADPAYVGDPVAPPADPCAGVTLPTCP